MFNKNIFIYSVLFIALAFPIAPLYAADPENMALIPAGEFIMGMEGGSNKTPHTVSLNAFYMDKYEVTQQAFEKTRGGNPSKFKGPDLPAEQVTWLEANAYCNKVGKRLPTEAEWEKAARGGTTTRYSWGDSMNADYAWFSDNSDRQTHPVGQKKANAYGLHDMSGNVWEWVADWYAKTYYETSPKNNPKGPETGEERVLRGGSWYSGDKHLSPSTRYWSAPNTRNSNFGFRCAADLPKPSETIP